MNIDKSMKLVYNEFQRSVTEVPLEVYYQSVTSDQYSSSGFQFNVKQPGTNALLDPDVWVKYRLVLRGENYLGDHFGSPQLDAANRSWPAATNAIALRGGNVVGRALQNLSVMINNTTLTVQPYRYAVVLDRIYISNDQSEHEFSASGGRFDEGNHGSRVGNVPFWRLIDTGTAATGVADHDRSVVAVGNAANEIYVHNGLHADIAKVNATAIYGNLRTGYPLAYEFMNNGFKRRSEQFALNMRARYKAGDAADQSTAADPLAVNMQSTMWDGKTFTGSGAGGAADQYWIIDLYERLPIPIFKMYSTDGVYGVIPNIHQMQIQGNFLTNMYDNIFRLQTDDVNVDLTWDSSVINSNSGTLLLRWYTPPVNMAIPRELSIPYPKINTWSTNVTLADVNDDEDSEYLDTTISYYNITLEAIPDLLMIYVRYRPFEYNVEYPDDFLMELNNLIINIDNASGKLNQITSLDLYLKWKKLIKHTDAKIINFDEWRKYCCVAVLQPEDYGVRYGPGYSNQTNLGLVVTCRNWYNNPSMYTNIAHEGAHESFGEDGKFELFVTSWYNKNQFIIRADGTAATDMLKIAADFNMVAPPGVLPPASA